jgi:hypothetical protein
LLAFIPYLLVILFPAGNQIAVAIIAVLENQIVKNENAEKINCFRCVYYANTWNPKFPRACKFFGFKSASVPSDVVFRSSGERCESFVEKKKAEQL